MTPRCPRFTSVATVGMIITAMIGSPFSSVVAFAPSAPKVSSTRTTTQLFGSVMELTNDNYADVLAETTTDEQSLVLVDCFAPWCGPCKLLEPVMAQVADQNGDDVLVCRYDVERDGSSSSRNFKVELALRGCLVRALPALVLMDAATGQVLEHWEGLQTQQQIEEEMLRPHHSFKTPIDSSERHSSTDRTSSSSSSSSADNRGFIRMKQEQDDYMLSNAFL